MIGDEKLRSHQELPVPGFALLPKPLLFRNHDYGNTKPRHINCWPLVFRRKKKQQQPFFPQLLVFVLWQRGDFGPDMCEVGQVPGPALDLADDRRLCAIKAPSITAGPWPSAQNFPLLLGDLFLAAVFFKPSRSSSCFLCNHFC